MKRFYLKQIGKGKSPQDAEVAAARKLACIVWKILTSKQRYIEEDRYLTARKIRRLPQIARRPLKHATKPEDISALITTLKSETDVLERYPEEMHGISKHNGRRSKHKPSTIERTSEAEGAMVK